MASVAGPSRVSRSTPPPSSSEAVTARRELERSRDEVPAATVIDLASNVVQAAERSLTEPPVGVGG